MTLPDYIDPECWAGFIEMRKSMNKKAWTPRAEKMALNKLEEYNYQGLNVNEILDQSTFMGWKGLFPVQVQQNGTNTQRPNYQSRSDQLEESFRHAGISDTGQAIEGDFDVID